MAPAKHTAVEPGGFIDISVPLSTGLVSWPGDPQPRIEPAARIERGDSANVSLICLSSHAGTHVDAPWHFIDDAPRLDSLNFADLIGPCRVIDLTDLEHNIEAADLDAVGLPASVRRLLIKTRNSRRWADPEDAFDTGFVGIAPSGAEWLVQRGIRLVGIDYLSVEPFDGDGTTHRTLLGARLVLLETLDLRAVQAGDFALVCLPLRFAGGDGAPCRALLRPLEMPDA
jgi:arylformamidase